MSKSIVIEKVSYGLTVKNGEDYEKCHLEGLVIGGNVTGAINSLKSQVSETLRIEIPLNVTDKDIKDEITKIKGESPSKGSVADAVEKVEKAEGTRITRKQKIMTALNKAEIDFNPRWSANDLQTLLDGQGEEAEEEKVVEEKKPKKSAVKEKVKKAKYQTYDRTIEEHMDMLCDLLDEEWPTWEDHHELVKKQVSMKLKGVEMLDEKGKMLDSFKDAVNERIEVCIDKVANS